MKLVVNNRRYTELVPKGSRPNLASHILGLAIRELPAIWERQWGYRPLLAETFCDIERAAGTCYRAAGWEEVGKTKGFSRVSHARDFYIPNSAPWAEGLESAEWTGLWARSPLPGHQAGRAARVSAMRQAGNE